MKWKVFVDGQEGTTGLKIRERLSFRSELEILQIEPEKRKEPDARRVLLNQADIAFLCLPDDAARESAALVENEKTRLIDASTAHRIAPGWIYGLPELAKNQREKIRNARRIAVPGCHATGFNMLLYPLVSQGVVPRDYPVTCFSVAGYSGGGRKMITAYESDAKSGKLKIPRLYALQQNHKHLPEMQNIPGLSFSPMFNPVVGDFYNGEVVSIPLFPRLLQQKVTAKDIQELLASYYDSEQFVRVMPFETDHHLDDGFLGATECNGTNRIEVFVFGNEERMLLSARFDNLGKGSSGAAIQNMNILLGVDEGTGLE